MKETGRRQVCVLLRLRLFLVFLIIDKFVALEGVLIVLGATAWPCSLFSEEYKEMPPDKKEQTCTSAPTIFREQAKQ